MKYIVEELETWPARESRQFRVGLDYTETDERVSGVVAYCFERDDADQIADLLNKNLAACRAPVLVRPS